MCRASNSFSLLLVVILAVSSLLMGESVSAQSIPKPSVPEFTLKYVADFYDVSTTYKIDSYTGEKVVDVQGYRVNNSTVQIVIKNQPFTPYTDSKGKYIDLYYNVSYKGYYGENWDYYSHDSATDFFLKQSTSDNTVISFTKIPTNGQIDFRIQAHIGFYTETGHPWMDSYTYRFDGESSGWSNTQTITIPKTSASASPNPTPTPSVPEFSWYIILPLLASIIAVALFLKHRQVKKS
jgi:hypothetical protein